MSYREVEESDDKWRLKWIVCTSVEFEGTLRIYRLRYFYAYFFFLLLLLNRDDPMDERVNFFPRNSSNSSKREKLF